MVTQIRSWSLGRVALALVSPTLAPPDQIRAAAVGEDDGMGALWIGADAANRMQGTEKNPDRILGWGLPS